MDEGLSPHSHEWPPAASPARWRSYVPFLLCVLAITVLKSIAYPSLSYRAEMFVEAGTTFFRNARELSAIHNLFSLDGIGYLVWIPRLWAVLVDRVGVPLPWVPIAYQMFAIVFVACCCSCFCLPAFRVLLPSDLARAIMCVTLAQFGDFWSFTYPSFAYFGAIPYFLILAVYPVQLSAASSRGRSLALGIVLALLGGSKALFLIFLPAIATLLAAAVARRRYRLLLTLGPALAALLAQAAVCLVHRDETHGLPTDFLTTLVSHFVTLPVEAGAGQFLHVSDSLTSRTLVVTLFAAVTLYTVRRRSRAEDSSVLVTWMLLLTVSVVAIGVPMAVIGATLAGFGPTPLGAAVSANVVRLHVTRWYLAPSAAAYLCLATAAISAFQRRRHQVAAALALGLANGVFPLLAFSTSPGWPIEGYSNWQAFAPTLASASHSYCVPLDDYPWLLGNHCDYLASPPAVNDVTRGTPIANAVFDAPDSVRDARVMMVGVALDPAASSREGLVLLAYDATGYPIATGTRLTPDEKTFTFFRFETPPTGIAHVALSIDGTTDPPDAIGRCDRSCEPVWVWLGGV